MNSPTFHGVLLRPHAASQSDRRGARSHVPPLFPPQVFLRIFIAALRLRNTNTHTSSPHSANSRIQVRASEQDGPSRKSPDPFSAHKKDLPDEPQKRKATVSAPAPKPGSSANPTTADDNNESYDQHVAETQVALDNHTQLVTETQNVLSLELDRVNLLASLVPVAKANLARQQAHAALIEERKTEFRDALKEASVLACINADPTTGNALMPACGAVQYLARIQAIKHRRNVDLRQLETTAKQLVAQGEERLERVKADLKRSRRRVQYLRRKLKVLG